MTARLRSATGRTGVSTSMSTFVVQSSASSLVRFLLVACLLYALTDADSPSTRRAKCSGRWAVHACGGGNGKRSSPTRLISTNRQLSISAGSPSLSLPNGDVISRRVDQDDDSVDNDAESVGAPVDAVGTGDDDPQFPSSRQSLDRLADSVDDELGNSWSRDSEIPPVLPLEAALRKMKGFRRQISLPTGGTVDRDQHRRISTHDKQKMLKKLVMLVSRQPINEDAN